jgi:hypothetical protein
MAMSGIQIPMFLGGRGKSFHFFINEDRNNKEG